MRSRSCPLYTGLAGLIIMTMGCLNTWYVFPKLETYLIKKNTALIPENMIYNIWKDLPIPFKMNIYFFNVSNPDEVHNGGIPQLKEIGPYVYDELRLRDIISTNEENDTIKYNQRRVYHFNRIESGVLSDEDFVTVINAGLVTTGILVESMAPAAIPMVNEAIPYLFLDMKNIFTTGKVRDILFDGMTMSCQSEEVEMVCNVLQTQMPPTLRLAENKKDYLAAMFYHMNNTLDGPFEVKRGLRDTVRGDIVSYQDEYIMDKWGSDFCNKFNGSDLTVLPSLLDKSNVLYYYVQNFCRSFHSNFDSEIEFKNIKSYRYVSKFPLMGEDSEKCFCTDDKVENPLLPECSNPGIMNIIPCVSAPILISYPHFYMATTNYLDYARGLTPMQDKHETYIIAEPKTGTTLSVRFRMQMNIEVRKVEGIDLLANVKDGVFPIIWLEQAVDVPETLLEEVRQNLKKLGFLTTIQWGMIVSGMILVLISFLTNMYCLDKMKSVFKQGGNNSVQNINPTVNKNTFSSFPHPDERFNERNSVRGISSSNNSFNTNW